MTLTPEQFAALAEWIEAEARRAATLMREPNLRDEAAAAAERAKDAARRALVAVG